MMKSDITNMLRVCRFLDWAGLDLQFDQVSIMEEYETQVPLEFDFCREASLLSRIGGALRAGAPSVAVDCPAAVSSHSTRRVLTLEFMDGVPFSALQRAVDNGGGASSSSSASSALGKPLPAGAAPEEMRALLTSLLASFGHQIFIQGVFHSDPHPGNLLRRPDGRVGLLDFGECKELPADVRILFARLTIALAQRNPAAALPLLAACGLDIEGATPEFAMVAAYIMFDTRMDMREAHMSPLDADAEDMRAVKVRTLPAELFMLLRVVTLVRGMLSLFKTDVSASRVWEPYARECLRAAGVAPPEPPAVGAAADAAAGGAAVEGTEAGGIYDKMYRLAEWMAKHELPHDRKALMPCAMNGLTTLADIAAADDAQLAKGLKKFSSAERERCRALARDATAAEAARRAAAAAAAALAPARAAPAAAPAPAKVATPAVAKLQKSMSKLRFMRAVAAK
jgi:aarF domain-containing kinase